jgi:hypothetical protein
MTLDPEAESPRSGLAERQLASLRGLLRRDFLTGADWGRALSETAQMAREALGAHTALVALYDQKTPADGPAREAGRWTALTHDGDAVAGETIRLVASLSILEQVRTSGAAALSLEEVPQLLRSKSATAHDLRSVLAVPIWFWGGEGARPADDGRPGRRFGGCLYADRRGGDRPFEMADVELVRDLAAVAERNLSLLRELGQVERQLSQARGEVELVRGAAAEEYRLAHYESRDPTFTAEVLEPRARRPRRQGRRAALGRDRHRQDPSGAGVSLRVDARLRPVRGARLRPGDLGRGRWVPSSSASPSAPASRRRPKDGWERPSSPTAEPSFSTKSGPCRSSCSSACCG